MVFNLNTQSKEIVKSEFGNETILYNINDGGILVNNWHRVKVQCQAANCRIEIKDIDSNTPSKVIEISDGTFARGRIGVFSNNLDGVFFDNFNMNTHQCWVPWKARENITVITPSTNYYYENFTGIIANKYIVSDSEESENSPSNYQLIVPKRGVSIYSLDQKAMIYDKSVNRIPSMAIKKNVFFSNGEYKVGFEAKDDFGIISIIFKYSSVPNNEGDITTSYYTFDLHNKGDPDSNIYVLRKYQNKQYEVLGVVEKNPSTAPPTFKRGYAKGVKVVVKVSFNKEEIKIEVSYNRLNLVQVLHYNDKKYLKNGLVGVGTWKARASFFRISTGPFKTDLTPQMIDNFIRSSSNKPLASATPVSKGDSEDESGKKDPNEKKSLADAAIEAITGKIKEKKNCNISDEYPEANISCLLNNTEEKRVLYCQKENKLMDQEYCQVKIFI